ncbi:MULTISPECIES: VTT domain-containing protein [unclassified Motilimonas]|uniref:TVP38/TMEM64 family protein n=1 Tax=Motilimonas TaxID=1914248 RepID=UPI001E3EAE2E|nr:MULTISPECIES: VTT domain-containing protein [unclassified Motilimonas]MCE0556484.1 VTT domain-containing protein [Motilimonas sp. E26]MDO6527113.1 VTT domain-containing protein [Motilimonas sp. 1_MG-2023]
MKSLFKVMLILALGFASTFIFLKLAGILSLADISRWLEQASALPHGYLFALVIGLLFLDLFIAMPTLTIIILSGYFLGFSQGALAASTGLLLAGLGGYILSQYFGQPFVRLLIRDPAKRTEMIDGFDRYGAMMILLSRAMPILPEVSACMAGLTKMPFWRFLGIWIASAVPYATIAAYAGSISTLQNPKPAILTAVGLSVFFWLGWYLFTKQQRKASSLSNGA